jgi:membrane-associated phospholipid phosphatase
VSCYYVASIGELAEFPSGPMDVDPVKRVSGSTLIFALLLLLFSVAAVALPWFDKSLTLRLHQAADPAFSAFMGRTLFQGGFPGGGDLVIFGMLIATTSYVLASLGAGPRWLQAWLPSFGYALFAALVSAVCFVHGLKWVIGRARPKEVVNQGLAYSDWFEIGPHYITEGVYHGSFPSGHTLAAMLIMLAAYVLAGDSSHSRTLRLSGWGVGVLALSYAGGMSVARSMSLSHWISDGVLGILLGWMLQHACYYWILKVPQQNRRPELRQALPCMFELRLGLLALGFTTGLTCALLGLRALTLGLHPLLLLVPFGACVCCWFARRGLRLYSHFNQQLAKNVAEIS